MKKRERERERERKSNRTKDAIRSPFSLPWKMFVKFIRMPLITVFY